MTGTGVKQGVLVAHRFDVARGTVSGDPIPVAESVGLQPNGLGAFSVSATGVLAHRSSGESRRQLAWLDRTGTVTGNLGPAEDTVPAEPSLAPNGQRLAVSRWVQGNRIRLAHLRRISVQGLASARTRSFIRTDSFLYAPLRDRSAEALMTGLPTGGS